MFYEYLINSNVSSNVQDISSCELELFMESNKSYIMETVYDFLNHFDKSKDDIYTKSYYKFLSFVYELKELKSKEQFTFHFMEDISDSWELSNDILHLKQCNLEQKETKRKTIEKIFKLDKC